MTPMINAGYVAEMAAYNRWQNKVVFGLCDPLGEARRREDLGLFFGSLHRTLAHILQVDGWILDTITGRSPPPLDFSAIGHETWDSLRKRRQATDDRIDGLTQQEPAWFSEVLAVYNPRLGRTRHMPRTLFLMQMFNHQTHHRAQATTALHGLGIDYGCTDLPYRPGSPY